MRTDARITQVGAQDPELRNSPIAQEEDEDTDVVRQQVPGEPVCWFNGRDYRDGAYVRSGSLLLKCEHGIWIDGGTGDPDHP